MVEDEKGSVILENEGWVIVDFGNDRRVAPIGFEGRTNFGEIPVKFIDRLITVGFDAEGYEIIDKKNTFVFTGNPIHLKIRRDATLGIIKGVVKTRDGQNFLSGAEIRINNDTILRSDSLGMFNLTLPEQMRVEKDTDAYLLTVGLKGYKTVTQLYNPKSSDAEIRLEKIDEFSFQNQ